jgi:hypothetical protein
LDLMDLQDVVAEAAQAPLALDQDGQSVNDLVNV